MRNMHYLFGDSSKKKREKQGNNPRKDTKISAKKGAYLQLLEHDKQRERINTTRVNTSAFLSQKSDENHL